MDSESLSSKEVLGLSQCLDRSIEYFLDACCPCFFRHRDMNPFIFNKRDKKYYAWLGLIHVKKLVAILIYIKALLLFIFMTSVFFMNGSPLFTLGCLLTYLLILVSSMTLFYGIRRYKPPYFLPYFFVSFVTIAFITMQFFIDFLDTANTKDTLSFHRLMGFVSQTVGLSLELYIFVTTWRLFNYVCDYLMHRELVTRKGYLNHTENVQTETSNNNTAADSESEVLDA